MKRILSLLILVVVLGTAQAAQKPKYTLYYLDTTRNVVSVGISADGKTMTAPKKLTSKGGYDVFDVSPNGRYIVGFTCLRSEKDEDINVVWSTHAAFIDDLQTKPARRTVFDGSYTRFDGVYADWSSKGNYFALQEGEFEVNVSVYSAKTGKPVVQGCSITPSVSSDERFLAFSIDSDRGGFVDLKTGVRTWLQSPTIYEAVWIGDTHKLAWTSTDFTGGLRLADVVSDGKRVTLKNNRILSSKDFNSLTYVSGKGLCFYEDKNTAYCSPDLKTVKRTTMPPDLLNNPAVDRMLRGQEDVIAYQADISPDNKFVACPVTTGKGKTPAIYLFSKSGRLQMIGYGRHPEWKTVKSNNRSWNDF